MSRIRHTQRNSIIKGQDQWFTPYPLRPSLPTEATNRTPSAVPRGTKATDSRITPRVRVMGLKPYGRDLRLDLRKPGGGAATPSKQSADV